jgi:hypothetical protein
VDPAAPEGPWYHQVEFEQYEMSEPVQAVVACTSLHHVADVGEVLTLVEAALAARGTLVVVEWAREHFDEPTARWCFQHLPQPPADPGWLQRRCDEWRASGLQPLAGDHLGTTRYAWGCTTRRWRHVVCAMLNASDRAKRLLHCSGGQGSRTQIPPARRSAQTR